MPTINGGLLRQTCARTEVMCVNSSRWTKSPVNGDLLLGDISNICGREAENICKTPKFETDRNARKVHLTRLEP